MNRTKLIVIKNVLYEIPTEDIDDMDAPEVIENEPYVKPQGQIEEVEVF